MDITIRNANKEDVHAMALDMMETQKLHANAFPDIYKTVTLSEVSKHILEQLYAENMYCRVAICQNEVCGHTLFEVRCNPQTLFTYERKFIYLLQIAVSDQYRKEGIGTLLINDMRDFASSHNINKIELHVWNFNNRARNFFMKQGFCDFGYRMTYEI